MTGIRRRYAGMTVGAAALLATLGACAADETSTARAPSAARAQQVTVSAREYKLDVRGVRALRPGFVHLTIRNDGRGEHGVELIGLRRKLSTPELLAAFENEDARGLREFSNLRGVFVRGEGDLIEAFAPPYGPQAQAVVDAAFGGGG
jgi:hypothetical protein